ncbi:AimR family lysis-lysogeny pheromone receptor [Bacillus horti]|uniref:Transcriptional regulator with XRE-family HTH domain n=1 Tax=Caldalkalibacillus horti TaxID=77523 RepID=A0ABT9W081_9BACI|nr:AimR family lysis-lysogeny pheromone receptor [Bacillus horti]MDQ0166658.1 transcriptional regulator with XRE-family HTH domain [Bacillus horti]
MLRERILQTLDKQDNIDQRKLARIAGLSESSISRFLHGFEEVNFESVLKMVKHLYPQEEIEIMRDYIVTQKSRNARHGLEYCIMNKLTDELEVLIENLKDSANPLDKEWAGMYVLIRVMEKGDIALEDLLIKVEMYNPKEIEMDVLKSILKGYIYFNLNEYQSLTFHVRDVEHKIIKIKSNFIKDSFKVRYSLLMSTVKKQTNDLESSRNFSYIVLGQEHFQHVKGTAYHQIGYSYMLDDFHKADEKFNKAMNFYISQQNEHHINKLKLDRCFLYSYHQLDQDFNLPLENCSHLLNYIFYLIQKDEQSLALSHLNEINEENLSDWDQAFYWYYTGLLTEDTSDFYKSVEHFIQLGEYFFLRLPIDELRKLGENENALNILSTKENNNEKINKANPFK